MPRPSADRTDGDPPSGALPIRHPLSFLQQVPLTNTASHATTTAADGALRRTTETKAATRTTEFIAYLAVLVAIVVTATLVGDNGAENGVDLFDARQAMGYITYLTIGCLLAHGLAASGSREFYSA